MQKANFAPNNFPHFGILIFYCWCELGSELTPRPSLSHFSAQLFYRSPQTPPGIASVVFSARVFHYPI